MASILEIAELLWRGEIGVEDHHPIAGLGEIAGVAPQTAFVSSFANVAVFSTDGGLVLVDTGSPFTARRVHDLVRSWSGEPLRLAVYSHGHIDHVFGVPAFEEEAAAKGWPAPHVVAHSGVPARFERYVLTAGYNSMVNRRQFGAAGLSWPTEYRFPDETYDASHEMTVGGERFELHHARGETDDHTWTWIPSRRVLCTGDLFIWAAPNAGNPQKVQRYPREWAAALREMAGLGAEILLPGHGFPVIGAERIAQALGDTASLLESLVRQTLALMNEGARLDDVLHAVRAPQDLLTKPYLRPVYDDPEFIVRNIWRLYGGWWDGNPATLKPAPERELAGEIATLAGGANVLAVRARELAAGGRLRLAAHLAEIAALAAPDDPDAGAARAEVYRRRAEEEPSTMAKGIFRAAAEERRE